MDCRQGGMQQQQQHCRRRRGHEDHGGGDLHLVRIGTSVFMVFMCNERVLFFWLGVDDADNAFWRELHFSRGVRGEPPWKKSILRS